MSAGLFALRGAVSVDVNDAGQIEAAAERLVREMLARNKLEPSRIISALFTSTADLTAAFPAAGARRAGFSSVPMMCTQEVPVPSAPPRIVRVMLHVAGEPEVPPKHVYLGEAGGLRPDLADDP